MSNVCPTHNLPWKTIPAGVSKSTGKYYESFQACPERGCREKPTNRPSTAPASAAPRTTGENPQLKAILTELQEIKKLLAAAATPKTPADTMREGFNAARTQGPATGGIPVEDMEW